MELRGDPRSVQPVPGWTFLMLGKAAGPSSVLSRSRPCNPQRSNSTAHFLAQVCRKPSSPAASAYRKPTSNACSRCGTARGSIRSKLHSSRSANAWKSESATPRETQVTSLPELSRSAIISRRAASPLRALRHYATLSDRLLRPPLYYGLTEGDLSRVVAAAREFRCKG
jgi:ribosomal protein S14